MKLLKYLFRKKREFTYTLMDEPIMVQIPQPKGPLNGMNGHHPEGKNIKGGAGAGDCKILNVPNGLTVNGNDGSKIKIKITN